MKTSKDPRHIERVKIMQELFSLEFQHPDQPINQYAEHASSSSTDHQRSASSQQIIDNKDAIDQFIQKAAPAWPIEKINKIDLAVLRLAVHELFYVKKAPTKVIVDEAVEIAKEYGSESSGGFVNGVLGTLIDQNPNLL